MKRWKKAELPKTKVFQKSRLGIEITMRKNPEGKIAIAISIGDCLLHCCMPDGGRRNVQASSLLYLSSLIFVRPTSAVSKKKISQAFFPFLHNLTSILRQPLPSSPRTPSRIPTLPNICLYRRHFAHPFLLIRSICYRWVRKHPLRD